jgi:hypothetical protein
MTTEDGTPWTTIGDIEAALKAKRLWLLSFGDQRRIAIAASPEEARRRFNLDDRWTCVLAEWEI